MSYVHELCRRYNASISRSDIEWFVDGAGNLRLRYRADFSAENGRLIESRKETERARFLRKSFDRSEVA